VCAAIEAATKKSGKEEVKTNYEAKKIMKKSPIAMISQFIK
jgi:hypothetical protein